MCEEGAREGVREGPVARERLQKIIAHVGVASRRKAEEMIREGRVQVNGQVVTRLGTQADPNRDHIKVDGKLIHPCQRRVYILFHKPAGVVTTLSDTMGRPTVMDFLSRVKERVYPVGRLDYNTEGLLLLTNDGEFAQMMMHPRFHLPKVYHVKVKGVLTDEKIERLGSGIRLPEGISLPSGVKRIRKTDQNSWIEMTLYEGKKRQIRRMLLSVGHPVLKLKRVRYGTLDLGEVPVGGYRYLLLEEVEELKRLALRCSPYAQVPQ